MVYGGTWILVVTMVDGMKDEGMDCVTIGVVEGTMEIALLLFGSKLGSIMIPFCKDVVGMEDKFGGTKNDSMWVGLLVGGWVKVKDTID